VTDTWLLLLLLLLLVEMRMKLMMLGGRLAVMLSQSRVQHFMQPVDVPDRFLDHRQLTIAPRLITNDAD